MTGTWIHDPGYMVGLKNTAENSPSTRPASQGWSEVGRKDDWMPIRWVQIGDP